MLGLTFSVIAAGIFLSGCATTRCAEAPGVETVELFDGESLDGWEFIGDPTAWGVVDGEIRVVNPGRFGWIRTEKMYRDYVLNLEFYLEEGTNSGVGLRCAGDGDPAFTGMEIQIYDSHGDNPAINGCGAVYNAITPAFQTVRKPGEWNSYMIRLIGDELNVWLNGAKIHNFEQLDDRGMVHRPEDLAPLNERLTTGYIAFQAHGEPARLPGQRDGCRDRELDAAGRGRVDRRRHVADRAGWPRTSVQRRDTYGHRIADVGAGQRTREQRGVLPDRAPARGSRHVAARL